MTQLPPTTEHLTVAPLTNVGLLSQAMERVIGRTSGLPNIVEMHGPSGVGKTMAAGHVALRFDAYHVEVLDVWTRKYFLTMILQDMGIVPVGGMPEMMAQIGEQMTLSGRPLIIDEAGLLLEKAGGAKLIKDLADSTQGAIMLLGEETLPSRIERWERLSGRVLDWVPAQPVSLDDARLLAHIYASGVEVAPDIMAEVVKAAAGSTRRVVTNLDRIRAEAIANGWTTVDLVTWGQRGFYTGKAPTRRGRRS